MANIIKLDTPELESIEASKAKQIQAVFAPMAKMLEGFENRCNEILNASKSVIDVGLTTQAKDLRLKIAKVRIETEKIRKAQKEEYLRAGKAIDGISNILKWAVTEKENKLKEIENHFEIQEKERLEALQNERVQEISPYLPDAAERDLSQMDEDVWQAYFGMKKKDYDDRIAAERKAEAERIEKEKKEAEAQKKIKKENARLKREAKERERVAAIEKAESIKTEKARQAKEQAERKKREQKEREEREKHEAELAAERAEKERIRDVERKKREKLEAEIRAKEQAERKEKEEKKEAERKAKEAEEAKKQAEFQKGDKDKVQDLSNDINEIKGKYKFESKNHKEMFDSVCKDLEKIDSFLANHGK